MTAEPDSSSCLASSSSSSASASASAASASCPFCGIAGAHPFRSDRAPSAASASASASESIAAVDSALPASGLAPPSKLWTQDIPKPQSRPQHNDTSVRSPHPPRLPPTATLACSVPSTSAADDAARTDPQSFVVLASERVLAFLDILPMTGGHLLVASRAHRVKVADLDGEAAAEIGFWLPVLARVVAKVTRTTDYNIVQNNGARAAQVVPHVHFHIIPRSEAMPRLQSRSWTMFGRGQRSELDDEEGAAMAEAMRTELRNEIARMDHGAREREKL